MQQKFEAVRGADQACQEEMHPVDQVEYMAVARRSVKELDGLARIAHELKMTSMRERVSTQPLRQDIQDIISRSRHLIERSSRLSSLVSTKRSGTPR